MKKYIFVFSAMLLLFISIIVIVGLQNTRTVYNQIEATVKDIDSSYREILHVQIDRKNNIVFYLTNKEELGIVSLQKSLTGFKLKNYINKNIFFTDKDISWNGTERQDDDIHLLYGKVGNSETTQIIVVSEGNKPANIISNGSNTMWYFFADGKLHLPITIQTFNKDGEKLYETGDINFWSNLNE